MVLEDKDKRLSRQTVLLTAGEDERFRVLLALRNLQPPVTRAKSQLSVSDYLRYLIRKELAFHGLLEAPDPNKWLQEALGGKTHPPDPIDRSELWG